MSDLCQIFASDFAVEIRVGASIAESQDSTITVPLAVFRRGHSGHPPETTDEVVGA